MSLLHTLKQFKLKNKKFLLALIAIALLGVTVFGLSFLSNFGDRLAQAADPFQLTSVSPNNGPAAGGTNVTIDGTGFSDGINVTQTASGSNHTCALLSNGNVQCWGYNYAGQLGYGDTTQRNTPGGDVNVGGTVTQISAGSFHTCALLSTGNVRCWGEGFSGELGYGVITSRNTPGGNVNVGGSVTQISAGTSYTCALLSTGNVRCWGYNGNGQLGYGDTIQRNTPGGDVNVGGAVTQISTGQAHTCALLSSGNMRCWGGGYWGELGDGGLGDNSPRNTPGGDVNVGGACNPD